MKRPIGYLFAVTLGLTVFACGGQPQPAPESLEKTKQVENQKPITPAVPQMSADEADQVIKESQETALGGDLTSAEDALKSALQGLNPSDSEHAKRVGDIRYNLGLLAEWQGRYADARRQYEAALSTRPDFGAAVVAVGRLMLRSGDVAGAINSPAVAL